MGINVNGLGANPYAYLTSAINKSSSQTNRTESYSATFEGKISQTEKVELTEEEKLEAFKKEIWREIDSWPRNGSVNFSIQITDGGFKRMMEDPEYKQKVMNVLAEEARVARPPVAYSMSLVDENGHTGIAYGDYDVGKDAFEAHSKGKDSFYVKKAAKHQEEKKRLEEEILKKAQERKATMKEYFDSRYENQMMMKRIFSSNTQSQPSGMSMAQTMSMGAMATAAYENTMDMTGTIVI